MATLVVRQDEVEFTGRLKFFTPPPIGPSPGPARHEWMLEVEPDAAYAPLVSTRNGAPNPGGTLVCSVVTDDAVVGWSAPLQFFASAIGQRVRVVGTWCDDDDAGVAVIRPLGLFAIEREIATYDVAGWPVAVRDVELAAFAHAAPALLGLGEPHASASRSLTATFRLPLRPSRFAEPFARAYRSTITDNASAVNYVLTKQGGHDALRVTIETGAPAQGKGYFAAQIGLTYDEPGLDQYCPPGVCDLDGKHCVYADDSRFTRVPEHVAIAQRGDLALGPGDGVGLVSGIVAALSPAQVYDHMGIFVDNGWRIRHCTSSQDRLEDEDLYTAGITIKAAGLVELDEEKVPLNGFRPDLVRYGWPGAITQTVEEVYRTGRNSLNARWTYAATHANQNGGPVDGEDPETPGAPFRIYHLPRGERDRRVQFNDPERGKKSEAIVRLQDAPVFLGDKPDRYDAKLVRPHPVFEPIARPVLHQVAAIARGIEAHYRFFAYTNGAIATDANFTAPGENDAAWGTLGKGARWPAGTIGAMCSSFVWTAIRRYNEKRKPGAPPIVLEDRRDAPDPATGREYGTEDGFYQYHEAERFQAARNLVGKLRKKIRDKFDDKIPGPAYLALPQLGFVRDVTAERVSNQIANTFAFDAPENLGPAWEKPGEGDTASPDDTLHFWDLKIAPGRKPVQPERGLCVYGDAVTLMLTAPRWRRVPLFRKTDEDMGTGTVTGIARVNGVPTPGVTVRFDMGCATAVTGNERENAFMVTLGAGKHFVEGFIVMENPVTRNDETFRTATPLEFDLAKGTTHRIELELSPPSDLWRVIDVHLDADIHDRSFWGGDADARDFHPDWSFELRQDLEDDPSAPEDQRNTVLRAEKVWRTEPAVGSGVHVTVAIVAELDPATRAVKCSCDVALLDTDNGGVLGIGTSSNLDQLEHRDVTIPADQSVDVLKDVDFASNESVPERARVSLKLTNRRRPA